MNIFAQITKVDAQTGKVYGRAVQEVVDHAGEIFDYASSKPHFAKWSEDMAKATDGKSVGNVRAMHGKVAAGKLTEITFNDAEKAIDVCAEIVDQAERDKCLKGVYCGFSIGGRYAKKWPDEVNKAVSRYTAEPTEISLVDFPCVPTAMFTVVKADGAEELRKFETQTDNAESLAKWYAGQPDEVKAMLVKIAQPEPEAPVTDEAKAAEGGEIVEKAGAKHSAATKAHFEAMRKAHKKMGDHLDALQSDGCDDEADKAAHDEMQKRADELAKAADDLQKMTAERDALRAERDELNKGMEQIKAEIERIGAQPAAPKGAARVVEKALADSSSAEPDDKPVLKSDGSVDHIATAHKLVKSAYRKTA